MITGARIIGSIIGTILGVAIGLLFTDILPYLRAEKARKCRQCLWYNKLTGFCLKHFKEDTDPCSTCEKWRNGKISIFSDILGGKHHG